MNKTNSKSYISNMPVILAIVAAMSFLAVFLLHSLVKGRLIHLICRDNLICSVDWFPILANISLFVGCAFGYLVLKVYKVNRAFLIAVFSSAAFVSSVDIQDQLGKLSLLSWIPPLITFLVIYVLHFISYRLLVKSRLKWWTTLGITVLFCAVLLFIGKALTNEIKDKQFIDKQKELLIGSSNHESEESKINKSFRAYIPSQPLAGYHMDLAEYVEPIRTTEAYYELSYRFGTKIPTPPDKPLHISMRSFANWDQFNPPENCGPFYPDNQKSTYTYPCTEIGTVKGGKKVYRYSSQLENWYYVAIDETIVTLVTTSNESRQENIIKMFELLEAKSTEEFLELVKTTKD